MGHAQALLASFGASAPPIPTFTQQAVATGADASSIVTATLSTPSTLNSLLVACVSYISGASLPFPVSFDGVDGTQAIASTVAGVTTEIWYLFDDTGNRQAISLRTDLPVRGSISASEYYVSGALNGSLDAVNSNSGVAGATVTTGSVIPANPTSVVIGVGAWTANDYSSGPTNSFTRMTPTGGGAAWQESTYKLIGPIATNSTGWGLTAGINWAAAIATLHMN